MRRFFFATIFLLIAFAPSAHADDPTPIFPTSVPVIPAPEGFVEASALSTQIQNMAATGLYSWQRLIGIYYQPDALAEILNTGHMKKWAYCRAIVTIEFNSMEEINEQFKKLLENTHKEIAKQFDRNDPEIDEIVRYYEDASAEKGIPLKLGGMTVLGTLAESSNYHADSAILVWNVGPSDHKATAPFVVASADLKIGKQIITLAAVYPFSGKASILAANNTLIMWLKVVAASN